MGLDKYNEENPDHTKTINNVRNNSEKSKTDWSNKGAKANKDSVIIVADSMIKHVNGRDIFRSHKVKVRPNPGASTHDLMDLKSRKPWWSIQVQMKFNRKAIKWIWLRNWLKS